MSHNNDTRGPTVVIGPGLSLMKKAVHRDGSVQVTCPGCGATMLMTVPGERSLVQHVELEHEPWCVVLDIIEAVAAR